MTAAYVVVLGTEVKGTTNPAEVDATAKVFVLTRENSSKVKVRLTEQTIIILSGSTLRGPVKADEFLKLISNKPYAASACLNWVVRCKP